MNCSAEVFACRLIGLDLSCLMCRHSIVTKRRPTGAEHACALFWKRPITVENHKKICEHFLLCFGLGAWIRTGSGA